MIDSNDIANRIKNLVEKTYRFFDCPTKCEAQYEMALDSLDRFRRYGASELPMARSSIRRYSAPHTCVCRFLFSLVQQSFEPVFIRFDDEVLPWTDENDNYDYPPRGRMSLISKSLYEYDSLMFSLLGETHTNLSNATKESCSQEAQQRLLCEAYGFQPFQFNFILDLSRKETPHWIIKAIKIARANTSDEPRNGERLRPNPGNDVSYYWHRALVISNNEPIGKPYQTLSGYLELGACPLEYEFVELEISEHHLIKTANGIAINDEDYDNWLNSNENRWLKEADDLYDSVFNLEHASDNDIRKALGAAFDSSSPLKKARIYNVGNGNCIRVCQYGHRILYDIGAGIKNLPRQNPAAKISKKVQKAFIQFMPDLVILSHWDSDHTYGCLYASDDIYRCKWIAPSFESYNNPNDYTPQPGKRNLPIGTKRIALYLHFRKALTLVSLSQTRHLIASASGCTWEISLYRGGKGTDDSGITLQNRRGLVLSIRSRGTDLKGLDTLTLMMGDVPYSCITSSKECALTLSTCDYLVVPHHGSSMNTAPLSAFNVSNRTRYAIVSRGNKKMDADHKSALINARFKPSFTCDAELGVTIDLLTTAHPVL